jgi:hypothetical protein
MPHQTWNARSPEGSAGTLPRPGDRSMAENDLNALFLHQLKDTYFARTPS